MGSLDLTLPVLMDGIRGKESYFLVSVKEASKQESQYFLCFLSTFFVAISRAFSARLFFFSFALCSPPPSPLHFSVLPALRFEVCSKQRVCEVVWRPIVRL